MPESHRPGAIRLQGGLAVALQGWARLPLWFLMDGQKAGQPPTEGGRDALLTSGVSILKPN